jgi:hypothetical protein
VIRFKLKHGAWPATLAACMERVPAYPFDGRPIGCRVRETGFVVSSVGTTGRRQNRKPIAWEYAPGA